MVHRPVVTNLWVDGQDRETEVRAHCEKCHDDKMETERIRYPRSRGESLAALQGRRIRITIGRFSAHVGK